MKHGLPYNSVQDAREILDAIRRIVQILRLSDRATERQLGISAAQLFVLSKLASADTPLSINELADRTLTHQSSVSVVAQKLEKQKFLARARSEGDARRVELSLTPAAKKLLHKAPQAAQDQIIDAILAMPAAKRTTLARLLSDLAQSVGGPVAPEMFFQDRPQPKRKGAKRARS